VLFHNNRYLILLFLLSYSVFSQSKLNNYLKPSDTLNRSRRNTVIITETALASATLIGLNQLWYADYEKSKFQTINDNNEWLQMDKFGHVFSSYQLGRIGATALKWSGSSKKDQLLYGGTLGFVFLAAVEVMDGFSKEWGFSWGDIAANGIGTGLFIGQELLWDEQRIAVKFSFHQTNNANLSPDKLGNSFNEQVLKDYNGQTYWLSANIHSFLKTEKIPKWLNLAVGYGANGMFSGSKDIDNQLLTNSSRYRQYYLSFDVNLEKIKTNSHILKTILSILNTIKVPFPTLEFSKNRLVFHLLYY
jgi:hypothetical protein